jgi:hypothetical protein
MVDTGIEYTLTITTGEDLIKAKTFNLYLYI